MPIYSEPKLDVIVTCHNERAFILPALGGVVTQSAAGLIRKIIVVDDGSSDGSAEILDGVQASHPNIEVHHIANRGVSGARNHGLRKSSAPFVAFLDGDDIWHPRKLESQLPVIERGPGHCAVWYTDYFEFEEALEDGVAVFPRRYDGSDRSFLRSFFVYDGPIMPSSAVVRRAALDVAGGFKEDIKLFEETELWLRLACRGYTAQHVPGLWLMKRRRANGLSANLARWEEASNRVTAEALNLEPALAPLARRRMAYRLAKLGYGYLYEGRDSKALHALVRSLAKEPLSLRALFYLLMISVPRGARRSTLHMLKRSARAHPDMLMPAHACLEA